MGLSSGKIILFTLVCPLRTFHSISYFPLCGKQGEFSGDLQVCQTTVIPAKAGTQTKDITHWIPAYTGMTRVIPIFN